MSYVTPTDIGSKYRFLAHAGSEYVKEVLEGRKPEIPQRFPEAVTTFFEKVVHGSQDGSSLEDMVHYRLGIDALDGPKEQAPARLKVLAEVSASFVAGKGTVSELTVLQSFFEKLFRLSDRNATESYVTGKASYYTIS